MRLVGCKSPPHGSTFPPFGMRAAAAAFLVTKPDRIPSSNICFRWRRTRDTRLVPRPAAIFSASKVSTWPDVSLSTGWRRTVLDKYGVARRTSSCKRRRLQHGSGSTDQGASPATGRPFLQL